MYGVCFILTLQKLAGFPLGYHYYHEYKTAEIALDNGHGKDMVIFLCLSADKTFQSKPSKKNAAAKAYLMFPFLCES